MCTKPAVYFSSTLSSGEASFRLNFGKPIAPAFPWNSRRAAEGWIGTTEGHAVSG